MENAPLLSHLLNHLLIAIDTVFDSGALTVIVLWFSGAVTHFFFVKLKQLKKETDEDEKNQS